MPRRRSKTSVPAETAAGPLAPHAAQGRAQELAKERARLLREVQKKQRQLELVKARARDVAELAVARMAPILARQQKLAAELAALFEELLADARLSARARKQLERLRRSLELQGLLEPRLEEDAEREDDDDAEPHAPFGREGRESPPHARPRSAAGAPPEVAGARQVGQQRRSLRDLFRSLARA